MNSSFLKFLREKYAITQAEFAKELKISRSAYESYENGRCFPDLNTMIKIANFFGISFFKLIRTDYFEADIFKQILLIKEEAE